MGIAGAAADRRRPDKTAAGLCRRRRDRGRRRRRWQDKPGRDLRAWRPRSADDARDHRNHSRDHRKPAHTGFAAVWLGEIAGAVFAVCAGAVKADAGPGGAIAQRQCGVGRGESRRIDPGGAGNRAGFAGSVPPAISLARPQDRTVRALGGVAQMPVVPANAGTTWRTFYLPIASAIRPSVPTMTRHQANNVKPWRVTEFRNVFTPATVGPNDTQNPNAM